MVIKYCISDEFCIAEFDDISFKDGVLTLTPSNLECLSIIIEKLSYFEAKSILDEAFNFLRVDLTKYKDRTFYIDE